MKKLLYLLCIFLLFSFAIYAFLPSYLSVSYNDTPVEITIPEGASLNYVAQLLYDADVIKSRTWFKYRSKAEGIDRKIRPGSYVLDPDMSLEEIFILLQKGAPQDPVILTIPEGFTLYQIAERVEAIGFGTKEDFISTTTSYFEDKDYDFDTNKLFYPLEGYLYPDTYYFNENQSLLSIVNTLATKMQDVFTTEYKERAEEMGLSVHEVLTIASLIEREAYNNSEKATISGVIFNRLNRGMPLQIDATVIYGIGKGKEHISRVLYVHLEDPSPFNTYKVRSIPPGPIAAPSKTSIHATLYPEDHDYLYYVLGADGHVFSRTHREHLVNVENYRRLMNQN
ncbi:MAG: endolytic transglycosylase MltG [Clostridiaceae bacterium]|nr:endolytic transglycosylase MltG [Clostridiaceae bacterium]